MSIGKSSIARAVNATNTAAKTQNTTQNTSVNKFAIDNIGLLSIAKEATNIADLKRSIENRGIVCPVLVACTNKGDIWLVDGYRRFAVAKELKIKQIDAIVINVDTKTQANNLYNELNKTKPVEIKPIETKTTTEDIHEEKFRVLCIKDRDLPTYLL